MYTCIHVHFKAVFSFSEKSQIKLQKGKTEHLKDANTDLTRWSVTSNLEAKYQTYQMLVDISISH